MALAAAGRGSGGAEISAFGFVSGSDADGRFGAADGDAAPVASARVTAADGAEHWDAFGSVSAVRQVDGGSDGVGGASDTAVAAEDSTGFLVVDRATGVSGCGELFVSPGEQLMLAAAGFSAGSSVSFVGKWASAVGDSSQDLGLPAAVASADGALELSWTVPSAPDAATDPVPRGYAIQATGRNPGGGTHTVYMLEPVVAYPATAPCAADDAVSTSLGAAVSVDVLANDVAPSGGSLDKGTVVVQPAADGIFDVDASSGVVSFSPSAGFWGKVATTYAVYDGWGVGVEATLSVTVDAGCTVTGTAGVTPIEGTDGDDVICVPDRDDHRAFHVIDAKGGDDVILGGAGVEWVYAGAGADVVYGNGGDDRIVAGAGVDMVYGGAGSDSIYSEDLVDTIVDDDYETVLSAPTPAQSGPVPVPDWVWANVSGTVLIDVLANDHDPNEDLDPSTLAITAGPANGEAAASRAADGRMVIEFSVPSTDGTVVFSYEICDALGICASSLVTAMVGTADCTIVGTARADTLRGTPGDDVICGLGGHDSIRGLGGHDILIGGRGRDVIHGDGGNDVLWGGPGDDTLRGDSGDDTLWGGSGADRLWASTGADRLFGGGGDDIATGGDDADRIWGGPGDDTLRANGGDDIVWGGDGDDVLFGGNDTDIVWGGPGDDTIRGGAGDDTVWGGIGDDYLDGLNGKDTLWGGPGHDTLRGDSGADRLWGGPGDDTLDGNNGVDHLDGGAGTDTCRNADTQTECD